MKTVIAIYLLFLLSVVHNKTYLVHANPMDSIPEIGKPAPPFTLNSVENYSKQTVTSNDLKGKFVILDFWNKGCVSCVQSFPKLNEAHEEYKGRLDIILIGTEQEGIKPMFTNFKKKLTLRFPFAFNQALYNQFVPYGAPHLVWIDDKGVVQAITGGIDLTRANIDAFINGREFNFLDRSHKAQTVNLDYDFQVPYLVNGNGGVAGEFLYRSLLQKYQANMPSSIGGIENPPRVIKYREMAAHQGTGTLEELYRVAYTGELQWRFGDSIYNLMYPKIILELQDSALFDVDVKTGKGLYMYSLIVPESKATTAHFMKAMQKDLEVYFGYHARLEKRSFPVWILRASDELKKKIQTQQGPPSVHSNYGKLTVVNKPAQGVFRSLFFFCNYWENQTPPIFDETGIQGNIDLDISVNATDWADVQKELKKMGFSFTKSKRDFTVLVISDAQETEQ